MGTEGNSFEATAALRGIQISHRYHSTCLRMPQTSLTDGRNRRLAPLGGTCALPASASAPASGAPSFPSPACVLTLPALDPPAPCGTPLAIPLLVAVCIKVPRALRALFCAPFRSCSTGTGSWHRTPGTRAPCPPSPRAGIPGVHRQYCAEGSGAERGGAMPAALLGTRSQLWRSGSGSWSGSGA